MGRTAWQCQGTGTRTRRERGEWVDSNELIMGRGRVKPVCTTEGQLRVGGLEAGWVGGAEALEWSAGYACVADLHSLCGGLVWVFRGTRVATVTVGGSVKPPPNPQAID